MRSRSIIEDSTFSRLFGCPRESISSTCLLSPFLPARFMNDLGIQKTGGGLLFQTSSLSGITIVKTGMGAARITDAVLALADSPCENIYFLGTCGAFPHAKTLSIGSVICPQNIHDGVHPLHLLQGAEPTVSYTQNLEKIKTLLCQRCVGLNSASSFGSLVLENNFIDWAREHRVDVVDMESAVFLACAGQVISKQATVFLVVSDLLQVRPFTTPWTNEEYQHVLCGFRKVLEIIQEIPAKARGLST